MPESKVKPQLSHQCSDHLSPDKIIVMAIFPSAECKLIILINDMCFCDNSQCAGFVHCLVCWARALFYWLGSCAVKCAGLVHCFTGWARALSPGSSEKPRSRN